MKKFISVSAAKSIRFASKFSKKKGSNLPGVIARKIKPDILKDLAAKVDKVIFITGTNGKTTTSQVVGHILESTNQKIIHNAEGSNLITGITSAFLLNEPLIGKKDKATYAVIEIDEGSIERVCKEVTPDYVVVTNFFRDQLDRFGEIDTLIDRVGNALKNTGAKLILNADDPFTCRLASTGLEAKYYGLSAGAFKFSQHGMSESTFCPKCSKELIYNSVHYGQLGDYSCDCGFSRPETFFEVEKVTLDNGLYVSSADHSFQTKLLGSYNAFNLTAAIAICLELGISPLNIQFALNTLTINNGRMELLVDNKSKENIILNLAKNPAGVNVSLSEASYISGPKQYLFALNDMANDGLDISWIYDADFEKINNDDTVRVICTGLRANDMALRMKYAGVPLEKIVILPSLSEAVIFASTVSEGVTTVMVPNYTALTPVRNNLLQLTNKGNK